MKILYFDCFSGISGDMAVGAMIDAGVPLEVIREGLAKVGLDEETIRVATRAIVRSQIHATKFDVLAPGGEPIERDESNSTREGVHEHNHNEHVHLHSHDHDHTHTHGGGHSQAHHSDQGYGEEHHHTELHLVGADSSHGLHGHTHGSHEHSHGSYREIVQQIERSELSPRIRQRAVDIFRAIAVGESRIHNVAVEDVHFHEVGALDSIADIVAVAICLEHLGIEEVFSSPIPLGSGGMIKTQHGIMPLPAPATLEILKGHPIQLTDIPFELTTPTGAGIISALSRGTIPVEELRIERVGFGAGQRELAARPNLLRVMVGEKRAEEEHDEVTVIEANLDDLNPQIYPYLLERLFEWGANEAYLTPVIMKKGRPGMLLTVLSPSGAVELLTEIIYQETTTIGVRYSTHRRSKLQREEVLVETEWGSVRMKKIMHGPNSRVVVEFEEAARIAREHSLPLPVVFQKLDHVARTSH